MGTVQDTMCFLIASIILLFWGFGVIGYLFSIEDRVAQTPIEIALPHSSLPYELPTLVQQVIANHFAWLNQRPYHENPQSQSPLNALRNWKESDIATPVVHSHSFSHAVPYLEVRAAAAAYRQRAPALDMRARDFLVVREADPAVRAPQAAAASGLLPETGVTLVHLTSSAVFHSPAPRALAAFAVRDTRRAAQL